MKTYNIIEVLNMPIGTEFTIENDIEPYTFVVKKGECNSTGLYYNSLDDFIKLTKDNVNLKFVKAKKPLTFFEAMKLVDENKKVTNEYIKGNGYYFKNKSGKLAFEPIGPTNILGKEINIEWYEYED